MLPENLKAEALPSALALFWDFDGELDSDGELNSDGELDSDGEVDSDGEWELRRGLDIDVDWTSTWIGHPHGFDIHIDVRSTLMSNPR